jgi:hypothetical protein
MNEPTLWGGDFGKVGNNHPVTSHKAAMNLKAGTQKHQIVKQLFMAREGLTAFELYGKILNNAGHPVSTNQIATRLLELREYGAVDFRRDPITGLPETRTTSGSNEGQVQELTQWGRNHASG